MLPIFNEYIQFLHTNNISLDIKEGYYWLNNQCIKAFDKKGNIHKIARIKIDKDKNILCKLFKTKDFEIESWKETAKRYKQQLKDKENESIEIVKELISKYKDFKMIICHSGGKDSTVLENIIRKVDNIKILYNNTSNESADTYKYIKGLNNYEIANPKEGFWQYVKRVNFIPSRLARGCCVIYKHNLTLDYLDNKEKYLLFMGMRNEESNTRSDYKYEHTFNYYPDNWTCGLPIRKWTELEIWLYIIINNIKFNNIYRKGYRRCGCIICPFRSSSEDLLTNYFFPKIVDKFKDVQKNNFFAHKRWLNLHCTLKEFIEGAWKGGLFRPNPTYEVINEFSKYMNLNYDIAEKYFEKNCCECDKKITKSDDIAMNMKMFGREINKYYCKKHLMNKLNIDKDTYKKYIEEFKQSGCNLF